MPRSAWLYYCLASAVLCSSGCNRLSPYTWYNASPQFHEAQIQRFDPYPDNDIGPEMEGVRPPDFQTPVSIPARSRWLTGGASYPRRAVSY